MRVLVLSSTYPSVLQPTRGVFVRERVQRLAHRCQVTVVAPVPWFPFNGLIRRDRASVPKVEDQAGLTVYHPRFFSLPRYGKFLDGFFYFLSVLPFLARLRRTCPFEVIDAHFAYPDGLAGVLLARIFRCPVVVTLRGSIVRLQGYRLHRPQIRWVLRRADRVTAVSDSLSRVAVELADLPMHRVRVIPNGVDSKIFVPIDRIEARRRHGLPEKATILITVAGIYEGKGQHAVVEILPTLLKRYPDVLFLMVGNPRPGELYQSRLVATAGQLGVADHVRFVGPRPHSEIAEWLSAADLSVLPTRSEGWPNALLESLACGTPVVATRVGGTPEIVRDGEDGLLVPYGHPVELAHAIQQALETPWDRDAMVCRARRFDWNDSTERALQELTSAIEAHS